MSDHDEKWTALAQKELRDTPLASLDRDYGGIPIKPVYFGEGSEIPGVEPFTRGPGGGVDGRLVHRNGAGHVVRPAAAAGKGERHGAGRGAVRGIAVAAGRQAGKGSGEKDSGEPQVAPVG